MKKQVIYYTIFVIIVIVIASVAAAYAYFTVTGGESAKMGAKGEILEQSSYFSLAYSGATELSLEVTRDSLGSLNASNTYTSYIENDHEITITLTSDASVHDTGLTCNYAITYEPEAVYTASSGATAAGLKELTIYGSNQDNASATVSETNLAGVNSKITLYTGSISTSSSTTTTSNTWHLYLRFYNLNVNQADVLGQAPSGILKIENTSCVEN